MGSSDWRSKWNGVTLVEMLFHRVKTSSLTYSIHSTRNIGSTCSVPKIRTTSFRAVGPRSRSQPVGSWDSFDSDWWRIKLSSCASCPKSPKAQAGARRGATPRAQRAGHLGRGVTTRGSEKRPSGGVGDGPGTIPQGGERSEPRGLVEGSSPTPGPEV